MKVHLYTTDISALDLLFPASDRITAVIIPSNRAGWDKVNRLTMASPYEVFIHTKGHPTTDMGGAPIQYDAEIAVSWMYTQLFPEEILQHYPRGVLNFHAGDPGPHAFRKALEGRANRLRCFWHRCVAEVDAGEVFAEKIIALWHVEAHADAANRDAMITAGKSLFPWAWKDFKDERKAA